MADGGIPIGCLPASASPRDSPRRRSPWRTWRRRKRAGYRLAEDIRYNERSTVERVGCQPFGTGRNGRLEDDFGGEFVRARGLDKIMCHLMFGILAPAVEQSMRQLMQAPIRLPRR